MDTHQITYKIKTATENEINAHLEECNDNFLPPLSQRININEYSKKIFEKSITFEAWISHQLAGLIAAYFDEKKEHPAFITNVSVVKNYMNSGIGSALLNNCIEYAIQHNFAEIKLEVNKDNDQVVGFYKKHGFIPEDTRNDTLVMKRITTKTNRPFSV